MALPQWLDNGGEGKPKAGGEASQAWERLGVVEGSALRKE
jgi:hypothetical protein